MDLTIDVYSRNKKTGKYEILQDKVTENDIAELIKGKKTVSQCG